MTAVQQPTMQRGQEGNSLAALLVHKAISRAAVKPSAQQANSPSIVQPVAVQALLDAAQRGSMRSGEDMFFGGGVSSASGGDLLIYARVAGRRPPCYNKDEVNKIRAFAVQSTCRLVCACALTANIDRRAVAQLLLLHLYGAIKVQWGFYVVESILAPFVVQFCAPREWAKCTACCRKFRRWGIERRDLTKYWLAGYCREGHAEVLELAVTHNVPSLARTVIAAGADVNFPFEQLWFRTPLHRAAMRGNMEMCRLLLDLRADAAVRDTHGCAPIHLVATKGRLQIADLLLVHDPSGATAVDNNGRTPCHQAAMKGHLPVIQRLVESRADLGTQNHDGRTAADTARRNGHFQAAKWMDDTLAQTQNGAQEEDAQAT